LPPPAPEPTPGPVADLHADPELEALFPTSVGGQPLAVQSFAGSVMQQGDEDTWQAIEEALASVGRTIDDVTVGFALTPDFDAPVTAFRVAGADAAALLPAVIAIQDASGTQTPGEIAGKSVVIVDGAEGRTYAYARDDVIWLVKAEDPGLTEIFSALP
jgi:hypothetical protein